MEVDVRKLAARYATFENVKLDDWVEFGQAVLQAATGKDETLRGKTVARTQFDTMPGVGAEFTITFTDGTMLRIKAGQQVTVSLIHQL